MITFITKLIFLIGWEEVDLDSFVESFLLNYDEKENAKSYLKHQVSKLFEFKSSYIPNRNIANLH